MECIARYAGGAYDMSKMDRIMLKFRPIAPKPAVGGSVTEKNDLIVKTGRTKRRYVRDNGNNNNKRGCNRKKRVFSEEEKNDVFSERNEMITLPLLPEVPDRKDSPERGSLSDLDLTVGRNSIWLCDELGGSDRSTVLMPPAGYSCLTVGCLTETFVEEGEWFGCTDEETRRHLERDTCPGFISDGLIKVEWTNEAYKRMVGQIPGWPEPEMVWVLKREMVSLMYGKRFVCRVRVEYNTCGNKERNSVTVPCDVWRMESGRFAWRLDVKAALSLGR